MKKKTTFIISTIFLGMGVFVSGCLSESNSETQNAESSIIETPEKSVTTTAEVQSEEDTTKENITEETTTTTTEENMTDNDITETVNPIDTEKEARYRKIAEAVLDSFLQRAPEEAGSIDSYCQMKGWYFQSCTVYVSVVDIPKELLGLVEDDFDIFVDFVFDGDRTQGAEIFRYGFSEDQMEYSPGHITNLEDMTEYEQLDTALASATFDICQNVRDYRKIDATVEYMGQDMRVEGAIFWYDDGSVYVSDGGEPMNYALVPCELLEDGKTVLLNYIGEFFVEGEAKLDLETNQLVE